MTKYIFWTLQNNLSLCQTLSYGFTSAQLCVFPTLDEKPGQMTLVVFQGPVNFILPATIWNSTIVIMLMLVPECQTLMGAQSICLQSFKDNLSVHAERSFTPRQESNCENCIAWPCLYVCLTERQSRRRARGHEGARARRNLYAHIFAD